MKSNICKTFYLSKPQQRNEQISPIHIHGSSISAQRSEGFSESTATSLCYTRITYINTVDPPGIWEGIFKRRSIFIQDRRERICNLIFFTSIQAHHEMAIITKDLDREPSLSNHVTYGFFLFFLLFTP